MNWNTYFLNIAAAVALKSKDPNTKVGAVIVRDKRILSTGYNGMVSGAVEIWTRPEKYDWVCHAEANAISFAARNGAAVENSEIFITHAPCLNCTKLIIQAGIDTIIYREGEHSIKYAAEYEKVHQLCFQTRTILQAWPQDRMEKESINDSTNGNI